MAKYCHEGIQKIYTLHLFFIFLLLCSPYVADLIKKVELHLVVVSVLLKIKFGHAHLVCPKSVYRCRKQAVSTPVDSQRFYKRLKTKICYVNIACKVLS